MKKQDAVNWAASKLGQRITLGQPYGAQCAVFVIAFLKEHFGVHPTGNAINFLDYKYPKGFQVIKYDKNKPQVLEKGDIFILANSKYGHTGIVTEANYEYFNGIEQNWYNANLDVGSPAAFVEDHDYSQVAGVIRPPYEDAVTGLSKNVTKVKTINEAINYEMPNRDGSVLGVVIHNTAGSSSALQDYYSLRNAGFNRYALGIAHYYIDRNTVWRAINTYSIGWHVADSYGNNGFIGFEVNQSMSATNEEFLANEQVAFKKVALDMLYYGLPVDRSTVKLHCEFVPTACPHRSMTIHTGWNPVTQGAAPQYIVDKLKDYFISQIKRYYDNPGLPATAKVSDIVEHDSIPDNQPDNLSVANPKKLQTFNPEWQINDYGIRWIEEHGTFTCTVEDGIYTRFTGPSREFEIAGLLREGESVDYFEKQVYDGHVWISWDTYGGDIVYMPVRTYNEVTGEEGELWGDIS